MTNKKLGVLLLPLLPLTAIGIVEVADAVVSMTEPAPVEIVEVEPIAPPPAPAPIEVGPQPVITT